MEEEKPTVLFIDSNEILLKIWKNYFSLFLKLKVLTTRNPREARTIFQNHQIDIIFVGSCKNISENLPEAKTVSFIKHIKALGYTKSLVALSVDETYIQQMLKAGCNDVLRSKNFKDIENKIKEVICS